LDTRDASHLRPPTEPAGAPGARDADPYRPWMVPRTSAGSQRTKLFGGLCSGDPSSMAGPRMALAELDGPGARAPRGSRARLAWALLPPAAAAFTFFPVTRNYFVGDDFLHLLTFANDGLLRFLGTPFGGHVLVVRNLAFALCVRAFGTDPTGFFWTVLATHVVNAGLLYLLLVRFVGSRPVACLVALLWGAAPHHGVALGWYSVYGEAL